MKRKCSECRFSREATLPGAWGKKKIIKPIECRNPESEYFASWLNVDIHGTLHREFMCSGCPDGEPIETAAKARAS